MEFWMVLAFLGLCLVVWELYLFFRKKKKLSRQVVGFVEKHWKNITDKQRSQPAEAIIEADKLLDYVLGQLKFEGSLGEKLKKSQSLFVNRDAVWSAHKLRNRIAHEVGYRPSNHEVRVALAGFRSALNDVGISLPRI